MESISGQLNKEELKKWAKNTLVFLAPAIVIFLVAIKSGASVQDALYPVYLWGLNVSIDFFKKLSQGA